MGAEPFCFRWDHPSVYYCTKSCRGASIGSSGPGEESVARAYWQLYCHRPIMMKGAPDTVSKPDLVRELFQTFPRTVEDAREWASRSGTWRRTAARLQRTREGS